MTIYEFKQLLVKRQPHALTRFGDGERNIFDNIDCNRKGFKYDHLRDQEFKQQLLNSFEYKTENYYVADTTDISACLFVNQFYPIFLSEYVPLFNMFDVIYVGHEQSNLENLPFKVKKFFPVVNNAWKFYPELDISIIQELRKYKAPAIVLFACGPYSNILVHRIWERKKKHILLNIGSVFDPLVYGINTRQYHERVFPR